MAKYVLFSGGNWKKSDVWTAFMTDGDGLMSEIPVLLQKEFYINELFLCTEKIGVSKQNSSKVREVFKNSFEILNSEKTALS